VNRFKKEKIRQFINRKETERMRSSKAALVHARALLIDLKTYLFLSSLLFSSLLSFAFDIICEKE
jgi:hypothetical protein